MKTIIATIALSLGFFCANAQQMKETEVPSSVKEGFSKMYPGVKVEVWEKEGADYEAEFDLNKVESSAVFAVDGSFKELEQEIKKSELPISVMGYCTQNFAGYKLAESEKITDAKGKVMYEAEMKHGKMHFDALFDASGNFVKKTEITEEDEEY